MPVNLESVGHLWPFSKQSESYHSKKRKSGHKWKHSGQVPIFPGMDFPANSLQGQIIQCSEYLQKA